MKSWELAETLLAYSRTQSPDAFVAKAIKLLQDQVVEFDMAVALAGTTEHRELHGWYLYELPESIIEDYEVVKTQDPSIGDSFASPGTTINDEDMISYRELVKTDYYQQFAYHYHLEHGLSTTLSIYDSPDERPIYRTLYVLRSKTNQPFSEAERHRIEQCSPWLLMGFTNNLHTQFLKDQCTRHALAFADRAGVIHFSEPIVTDLLKLEWPRWSGVCLPKGLVGLFSRMQQARITHEGKHIVIAMERMLDLITLRIHLRSTIDTLTPTEKTIADLYQTRSMREIAALLNISKHTVESHREHIYQTLEINSKTQLCRLLEKPYHGFPLSKKHPPIP